MYVTSKVVERAAALLECLVAHPYGIDRASIRFALSDYRHAASEAAFERMFERDKQVLRELGFVIQAERVGYVSERSVYRLGQRLGADPQFSVVDVVVLSHCVRAWQGTDLARFADSALLKVGTLTGQRLQDAVGEPDRFSSVSGLVECLTALAENKVVSFTYGADAAVRRVSCWGLGMRYGHWYVTGWDVGRQAQRTFRLDRMAGLKLVTSEVRAAPADFSMEAELATLDERTLPQVSTVARGGGGLRTDPSYGVGSSALEAIQQGRTHLLAASEDAAEGGSYQDEVAKAELRVRQELLTWHRQSIKPPVVERAKRWKSVTPQRNRLSAAQQLNQALLMVALLDASGGLPLQVLADFFGLTDKKAREQLDRLAASVAYETLEVLIDDADFVTVRVQPALISGAQLTELEVLLLCMALDLSAGGAGEAFTQTLKDKLVAGFAAGADSDLPLWRRVAVYRSDVNPAFMQAVSRCLPLEISYRSHRGVSQRVVEPIRLVMVDGPRYLRAWCRKSQGFRTFDLGRIMSHRLLTDQVFEHTVQDAGEVSGRAWRQDLVEGKVPSLPMILALPASLQREQRSRTLALAQQYATHIAEVEGWVLLKIPLVNHSWALGFLLELGPTVLLQEPVQLRLELLELLDLPGSWVF